MHKCCMLLKNNPGQLKQSLYRSLHWWGLPQGLPLVTPDSADVLWGRDQQSPAMPCVADFGLEAERCCPDAV